jgi:hypothetical protein
MSAATTATSYSILLYTSPSLYTATLKALPTGNKEYFYSCGSSQLGYSPVQSFKTHPGLVEDVTFFVLGDVGQTSNSVNTINELVEYEALLTSDSGGIISMGDLSYANGTYTGLSVCLTCSVIFDIYIIHCVIIYHRCPTVMGQLWQHAPACVRHDSLPDHPGQPRMV